MRLSIRIVPDDVSINLLSVQKGPRCKSRLNYRGLCISVLLLLALRCREPWKRALSTSVEIRPIDERIKELCKEALTADDSEVKTLLEELQALLAEHSEAARYLAAKTLNRLDKAS